MAMIGRRGDGALSNGAKDRRAPRMNARGARPKRRAAAMIAAAALMGAAGCQEALLASDPAPMPDPAAARPGVIYSLPTALLPVTIERGQSADAPSGLAISLSFGAPLIIPDERHTYTLAYQVDTMSSDEITVKTGGDGLLQSISTSSRDESANVAGSVVALAGELAKAAAVFGAPGASAGPVIASRVQTTSFAPPQPFRVDLLIDPFDPALSQKISDELLTLGHSGVSVELTRGRVGGETRSVEALRAFCAIGACYRRAAPVSLRVYDDATQTSMERTTLMPNNGVVGRLDFERRAFVENQASALFDNGMLVEVTYNDPSSAAGAAAAPVDLVASIVEIPARAFGAQTSQIEEERRLLAAQQSLLEQQIRLLETERRLEESRNSGAEDF
ncbi:MAG: hypothetical protein AAGM38_00900 [Pseudomonadota bacterium]